MLPYLFSQSLATLIFIFWGLLGEEWRYFAVVAVMAWGFGDAAAALVGKNFGRRRILHPLVIASVIVAVYLLSSGIRSARTHVI